MTRRAHVLVVVLLGCAAGARAAVIGPMEQKGEFESLADRLRSIVIEVRATAAVVVPGANSAPEVLQTPSFGTGVLLGDGLAVTTLHTVGVVLPGRMTAWSDIEASVPDLGKVAAQVVAWFPELDLAVIRLEGAVSIGAAPLATETPGAGELLIAMGVDEDAVRVVGVTVAGVSGDQLILASSRRIDSRYWGGPVFDLKGRLVGISLPSPTPKALTSVAFGTLLDRVRKQN
jgi:S1-C subfamily serine protease